MLSETGSHPRNFKQVVTGGPELSRRAVRLMGSECLECQQCDFELNAGSNREPIKTG